MCNSIFFSDRFKLNQFMLCYVMVPFVLTVFNLYSKKTTQKLNLISDPDSTKFSKCNQILAICTVVVSCKVEVDTNCILIFSFI